MSWSGTDVACQLNADVGLLPEMSEGRRFEYFRSNARPAMGSKVRICAAPPGGDGEREGGNVGGPATVVTMPQDVLVMLLPPGVSSLS